MLQLRNVTKSFGSLTAIDGLSLTIRRGEIFGLLGPNGAGKTTIMNMAVGLLLPSKGSIQLEGLGPPTDSRARSAIGIAPQSLALYDEFTGDENATFFGRLYGLSGQRLRDRVAWSLDFVGLSDRRCDRLKIYSEGMKRRLNLAVALVHDPQILLLDEPTASVDPHSRHNIHERIQLLRNSGCTVFYTTHYLDEAENLCDRIGILDRGRLVALGTVKSLIAEHGKPAASGQLESAVQCRECTPPLDTHPRGSHVQLSGSDESLEHVFLNLTGHQLHD